MEQYLGEQQSEMFSYFYMLKKQVQDSWGSALHMHNGITGLAELFNTSGLKDGDCQ